MPLLCPNCRSPIDLATDACREGHTYAVVDGVRPLLAADLARRLSDFEAALSAARQAEGKHRLDATAYEKLPYSGEVDTQPGMRLEWRLRRHDWQLVQARLAGRGPQRVLDIGGWNGWLSHLMTRAGHEVTAVDYFADARDGLGAHRFYRQAWRCIQLDLRDPAHVLDETFDLVIVNRCLAFFGDPAGYCERLKTLVSPGGLLLVTGMMIYAWARDKAQQVADECRRYQERYGFELFLFPTRGYLDGGDLRQVQSKGFNVRGYPQLWAANLQARLRPDRPRHVYATWMQHKPGGPA